LTGHLVLTTFHAGSAAGAISRLSDMGIEPYLLRSGILGILCQRLVRRLCDCAESFTSQDELLGLDVQQARVPVGCDACGKTGYKGRLVIAELLTPDLKNTGRAILSRSDNVEIEQLAVEAGMVSRWARACEAVDRGWTSPAEVRRVLGVSRG
jgi:general secretion pathway protein E